MNILITGVGGPTPRSFAIALKRDPLFAHARLIATDINPLSVGLYRTDLFDKSYVIPSANDADYWPAISQIVEDEHIDYAVIMPEIEVLEWSEKRKNGELPCPAFLPPFSVAPMLVDKSQMAEVLKDTTWVPPSVAFSAGQECFEEVFEALGSDFWVRSATGTSGLGSLRVQSRASLLHWIHINPDVTHFLASKFLPGRNLACKLLYDKGKLLRAASAERVEYIMAKVAPSGITGNTSFGRLLNEPKLVEISANIMDHIFRWGEEQPSGFYTLDFKEDEEGNPFLTEINVRHVAFTQCFAAAGANFAADTLHLLCGTPQFDRNFKMYEFEQGTVFLRDVDQPPILMKEHELLGALQNTMRL